MNSRRGIILSLTLFLFTADDRPELHENAYKSGVDMVVEESSDAAEIVNIVREEVASGT